MKNNTHTPTFNQILVGVETFRHIKNQKTARFHARVMLQKHAVDPAIVVTFIQSQIKVSSADHN